MTMDKNQLSAKALDLLQQLISIPSFSSEEDQTADAIEGWFKAFRHPFSTRSQ